MQTTQQLRKEINEHLAKYHLAKDRKKQLTKQIKSSSQYLKAGKESQAILQSVAKGIQESVHRQIATVVTRCIATVFENPYTFKIIFEKKRGKTEAKMAFLRDGKEFDPNDGVSGGMKDVASFGLRVACLMIKRPQRRRLLVLDEPFKHLDSHRVPRAAELLKTLSKEMNIQFIIVTHQHRLKIGKTIEIEGD